MDTVFFLYVERGMYCEINVQNIFVNGLNSPGNQVRIKILIIRR